MKPSVSKVRDLVQKRRAEQEETWRLCFKDGRHLDNVAFSLVLLHLSLSPLPHRVAGLGCYCKPCCRGLEIHYCSALKELKDPWLGI